MHSTTSSRSLADRGITSDALFVASLFSYVAALFTPAIGGVGGVCGLYALILGPLALLASEFSWLANILLWGAWLVRKKPKTLPVVLAILAIIVAGGFLLGHTVIVGSSGKIPFKVGLGYWLWLASMVLAGASALTYVQPSAKVQSGAA